MSYKTTDVSPNNNNKRNSELLGDSMICDYASRTDCDVHRSKMQINTNKSEIPPKNVTPSSEIFSIPSICEPPRSKKRKLSSFDELLKILDYGVLYTNLTKLLFFLESDDNKCIFSFTKNYEEFFELIVQDINILKSKSMDDDYRHISKKIIKAAAGKLLFYVFEYSPGFHKKVMLIKKVHLMDQSGNSTASITSSSGSLVPPSQTSTNVDTNDQSRSLFPAAISTGFKIHCLRTLLVFIKNNAIKTKEFPELNTDQAKFMQLLLGKVNIDNFDNNVEVTELYRALVKAVRINELKYEFRIKCDESWGGKKSVVFEKVPVLIPSETAVNSDQTAGKSKQSVSFKIPVHVSPGTSRCLAATLNSDQTAGKSKETMKPKTNVQNTEDTKTDVPKPDGPNPEFSKPDAPKSHGPKIDVLKPDTTKSNSSKINVPQTDAAESHGPKKDVLKPDALNSKCSKIDVPKPDTTKSNSLKIDVPQTDAAESHGTKKDVLKPDVLNSNDPKIDVLKPDIPKSNAPKIDVPKTDASKSQDPKMDAPQTDAPASHNPKIDVPQTNAPESYGPKKDVLKPDALKSNGPKIGVLKTDVPKSNGPKIGVPKTDASKSQDPKVDVLKPDILQSNGPKTDVLKPDAPKSQAPKSSDTESSKTSDSGAPNTEPSQPDVAEPWFEKPKPLIKTKRQIKYENHLLFMKNTPKKFIGDVLNKILDFLLNDEMVKLVLVPNTQSELKFYRKCIFWFRSGSNLSQFGEEFREVHCRISHLLCRFNVHLTKRGLNPVNEITGIREVTYVKTLKKCKSGSVTCTEAKEISDGGESQSLRSKKKDKKRRKAELKKAKKSKGASSSSSTSRDSSWDRVKVKAFVPPGSKVAKRPSSEMSQSPQKTSSSWSNVDSIRNEKLREAMSVPVQSDKAMRMMLGMGWNGGALGPRGDGITEPLMPAFEIARGAGFGHVTHRTQTQNSYAKKTKEPNSPSPLPVPEKPKEPNSPPPFVSGSDIVVEKTKQLLLEDITFDTIMDRTDPAKFNVLLSKPSESTVGLQKPNVEPSKPTTSKLDLPTQTRFSIASLKNSDLKFRLPFRMEILHSIWDLINSEESCKSLEYDKRINAKQRKFVNLATQTLNSKKENIVQSTFSREEVPLCKKIRNKYLDSQITVEARFFWDFMSIDLLKLPKKLNPQTPTGFDNKDNAATVTPCNEIINDENLQSYIFSMNGKTREVRMTMKNMEFKVLFLMNILKFVKSPSEEYEVTFNKVLNAKEKLYMENVVDQVNMRIKFGSSPAETKLGDQIREHVKDAFLGIMYDHEHSIITVSKYFRFKRLNRPDKAVRRKTQATVNLDDFTSETLIEPKINTDEPLDREIKYGDGEDKYEASEHSNEVTETDNTQVSTENTTANVSDDEISEVLPISNELGPYDSDDSSIEEYINNNANAKVPKLLPSEEGVNISNFLYLYDKEKTNTAGIRDNSIINNDSASNVTENRNSKNNSGNGNVVIDNNDNQFIDMKRAAGNAQDTQKQNNVYSEKAEYVVCVSEKRSVIEDSDNDCTENKTKDKIKNITENLPLEDFKGETDVIIKDIDAVKTMKIIKGINTEPVHEIVKDNSNAVINKDKSKVRPGDPTPAIIQGETMAVLNTVKSSKDKKVAQIKEGTSIKPSDENIVKDNLVIKSDCYRIKKDNIVLSEEFCNTLSIKSSREQTVGTGTDFLYDKNLEIINVRIGHTHHPIEKLSAEKIEKIQWHISNCIKLASELPLLKCNGVQNGALFYTCHNKKTYDWLQNTIGIASYVKVSDTKEVTKMALKLCGYFDFDGNYLFKMLEMYNKEISTKEWVIEKTEKNGDYIIFIVKMDKFSIKFIQESDLALFAGIDKVHFSLVCE